MAFRWGALLLAAGFASRMGACKILLPLGERTVLEEAVLRMRLAGIHEIVVVTGHWEEEIAPQASALGCRVVHNPRYEMGMFSSIQAGVKALSEDLDAFFLLPGDTPLVKPQTYRLVAEAWEERGGVVHPAFRGRRGHPPLIPKALFRAILQWKGEGGMRGVLDACGLPSYEVAVADRGILMDVDLLEDYRALCAYYAVEREGLPTREERQALFEIAGTPEGAILHGKVVARVAARLARFLCLRGGKSDLDARLLSCAALLHDIARGKPCHDREGARFLSRMGYPRLSPLVASHMDLPPRSSVCLDEIELLYLADKGVEGTEIVGIERRVQEVERRYAGDPQALASAQRRLERALEIAREIERRTGLPMDEMVKGNPLRA